PLVWVVRLGGGLALTGAIVLVGVTLALAAIAVARALRKQETAGVLKVGALTLVLSVALPLAGALSPDGSGAHARTLRVALVQGGGPRGTRSVNTDPQVPFNRQVQASKDLRPPLDLVVWPEGVVQGNSTSQTNADIEAVGNLARTVGATVVAGVEQDVGPNHYTNAAKAWSPEGQIVASYEKNHLVPFGEYVPARSLVKRLFNLNDVPEDAIRGRAPGFLRTPAGPLAVMISYEVFFDDLARRGVRAGGELLVVPTNTASYRSSQVPTEELAASELRARATGRWLVQVSTTGYTAVITPDGQVTERSRLGDQTVISATVALRSGQTLYVRWGDWSVFGVAAAVLIGAIAFSARSRREKSYSPV
ncbi:MAG: apolipoprotein N-acyltransferase, partial [Acidimicrobiaceae bacterium]|nr:apolipoprotein N-acyltransferase [Acidimicrobiaceae bacterium]